MGIALYAGYFVEWYQLLLTEWLLTTLFVLSYLMCTVDTSEDVLAPLAVGFSVSLSVFGRWVFGEVLFDSKISAV